MQCAALAEYQYLLENVTKYLLDIGGRACMCVASSLTLVLLTALTHWRLNPSLPI